MFAVWETQHTSMGSSLRNPLPFSDSFTLARILIWDALKCAPFQHSLIAATLSVSWSISLQFLFLFMFFRPSVHHSSPPQLPLDVLFMRMDDDDPSPKRKRMSVVCEGRFSLSSGSSFSLLWICVRVSIVITGIKAPRISQNSHIQDRSYWRDGDYNRL